MVFLASSWKWQAAVIVPTACVIITIANLEKLWQWHRYAGEPYWLFIEDNVKRAVVTAEEGLPRSWTKRRDLLGRRYYLDLLTRETQYALPGARQVYRPLQRGHPLSIEKPFEVRAAIVVPAKSFEDSLECILMTLPLVSFLRAHPSQDWVNSQPPQPRFSILLYWVRRMLPVPVADQSDPSVSALGNMLSYCWGDSTDTETIVLNDRPFKITRTLAYALRQLRQHGGQEPAVVWADAICINQEDLAEKSLAVQDMATYYQYAHTVRVSLGMISDEDAAAVETFRMHLDLQRVRSAELDRSCITDVENGKISSSDMLKDIQSYKIISKLPYWRRRWIIQEACVARSLSVYCGSAGCAQLRNAADLHHTLYNLIWRLKLQRQFLDPEKYRDHHIVLQDIPEFEALLSECFRDGAQLWWLRQGPRQDLLKALTDIVDTFRESHVSEPRDAVYSLLALTNGMIDMNVDYTLPPYEIFSEFAAQLMTVTQSLRLLYRARLRENGEDGYPSWMPDFTSVKQKGLILYAPDRFNASASATTRFEFRNASIFRTAALILGTIIDVTAQNHGLVDDPESREHCSVAYGAFAKFFAKHDSESSEHRFQWRLLCMDSFGTRREHVPEGQVWTDADIDRCRDDFHNFLAGGSPTLCVRYILRSLRSTRLFVTSNGHFGLTTGPVKAGHVVLTLPSAPMTFIGDRRTAYCDRCIIEFTAAAYQYWACLSCKRRSFILCEQCYEQGRTCDDSSHDLYLVKTVENHMAAEIRRLDGTWMAIDHGDIGSWFKMPQISLLDTCYLDGAMYGETTRAEALRRFGDITKVDDVFEDVVIS